MTDLFDLVKSYDRAIKSIPVLRTVGRVGYGKTGSVAGMGWRRVFWRFWWHDRKEESRIMARYAECLGLHVGEGETIEELRARMYETMRGPARRRR